MKVRNFIGKYENFSRTEFLRIKHSVVGPKYDKGSLNKFLSELGDWAQENIDKDEILGYACLEFFDLCVKDPDISNVKWWDIEPYSIRFFYDDPDDSKRHIPFAECVFTSFSSSSWSDPSRMTIYDDNSSESVQQYARDIFLKKYRSYFQQDIVKSYNGKNLTHYYVKGMYQVK